jgi:PAP2 superfamily
MRAQSFTILWTATLILGCPGDSPSTEALLAEPSRSVAPLNDNAVAVEWNDIAHRTANAHDQFLTFLGARTMAMTHIAMHDALNAIVPKYEQYAFKGTAPDANAIAAVTQAAYAVLVAVYPKQRDSLATARTRWLATLPNGESKDRGVALGAQAAAVILALRQGDGHGAIGDYKPGSKPGAYQFTPGFNFSLNPDFRFAKPFSLTARDQFRAPSPPALSSAAYATAFNEVKRFGVTKSAARTPDQTNYAHWWAEFAEHSWNRIGRLTAKERALDLWSAARMFALVNMDIFDVYLAIWDSKYHYNTWRPITAIRAAAHDGNSETQPDPAWEPEMVTLPFPEYPSGHSAVCVAGAEIVARVYGTTRVAFRMKSLTALTGSETRGFDDLSHAALECADSRVMNGYHFRFATEAGKALGRKVAQHLVTTQLRPLTR